ncbi:DegT/DnrJ/EryC1/StrS family aminotransferase [Microvirga sp. BT350]|uniref:DegT/DnrJ/EryC1/StrS family aminotransferase n=2 Tax=Microvirga alba TaxID=2791025 RepID=A0A931FPY1_9HYPH|nr:DegT/DnrJ/EryC1/StrS family aminotransferase [Microvirga alba]
MILREAPPTSGLRPKWSDLIGAFRGPSNLEERIAEFLDVPEVQLECSGTASLVIAFEYLKTLSRRRKVVIAGYTCPLVVLAAEQAGLRIAVCDTVRGGFDLDLTHLGKQLDDETLCVVPTHYGGALTDVDRVRCFIQAASREIFVIEDAAQSFGAKYNGRPVGTAGHIGIFSFAAGKGFTLYEGGCLYGETPEIRRGLRETSTRLRNHKRLLELRRSLELLAYHFLYNPLCLSFVYGGPRRYWLKRNDPIRAIGDYFTGPIPLHKVGSWRRKVGCQALSRLRDHLDRTRDRFDALSDQLERACPEISTHSPAEGYQPTGSFVFVTFTSGKACDEALRVLWSLGSGVSRLFACAIDEYPYLSGRITSTTTNASDLARRTLIISTSEMMEERQLGAIYRAIRS